jgi:hypothetical protein
MIFLSTNNYSPTVRILKQIASIRTSEYDPMTIMKEKMSLLLELRQVIGLRVGVGVA